MNDDPNIQNYDTVEIPPLDREQIDYARVAQVVVLLIAALVPWLADLVEPANAVIVAVAVLAETWIEVKKRRSVTPVDDPRDMTGKRLVRMQ